MSSISYFSSAIRSRPTPNANPEYSSGSIPHISSTCGCTIPKVGADTINTGVEIVQKVDVTTGERAEALSALMALGFTKNEAENAIKAVFVNGMATEEIISKALKVVK